MKPYYEHGGITISHGDCLEVMPTLEAVSVDMVLCDLPYGTTACSWDAIIPFAPLWEQYGRLIRPNGAIVLTACQPFSSALVMSKPRWFRHEWIWQKNIPTGHLDAKRRPMRNHEAVLVFGREVPTYRPRMVRSQGHKRGGNGRQSENWGHFNSIPEQDANEYYPRTVLQINGAPRQEGQHPQQKPVALMEYLIRTYTDAGATVLDNSMGSGTTGVACGQSQRAFVGIEKRARPLATAQARIAAAYAQGSLLSGDVA